MSDCAFIMFKGEKSEPVTFKTFFIFLLKRIRGLFTKPRFEDGIKKIKLYDDVNLYIIRLPFFIDEAEHNVGRLNKFFERFVAENNIKGCFLPPETSEKLQLNGCIKYDFAGHLLYKSLLLDILNAIYPVKGYDISDLDITIIEGGDTRELFELVLLLSPHVKYITILTTNKDLVQEEMNSLFEDTGLCVSVTSEFKSNLKNSDLIIDLGKLPDIITGAKVNPEAVILNYGGDRARDIICENTMINSIKISLPNAISTKIDKDLFEYYEREGVAEVLICHKTSNEDKIGQVVFDCRAARALSSEFSKDGYAIREFVGRRNTFKTGDIIL